VIVMDMKRFEYLLDVHGADMGRWDAADAAAARALLDGVPAARALLARARDLDDLLDAHDPGPMPETLAARAAHAIDRLPPGGAINDNRAGTMQRRRRYGGLALAACAVLFLLAPLAARVGGDNGSADPSAPARSAALTPDEVEMFVIAMADPFIETLEADPAARAAPAESAEIDVFVENLFADEAADFLSR
jgi:hypothetical protein